MQPPAHCSRSPKAWSSNGALQPTHLDGRPFDVPAGQVPGRETIATGTGGRFRIRASALDGRELVLDGSISPALDGAVVVFRDVTAEHERAVLNERYLYALFNSIPIPLTVAEAGGQALISANQAFLDLVGYELEEIAGLTPPYPWWEQDERSNADLEPGAAVRQVYRRKDDRPLPVELVRHVVDGDEGKPALLLGVVNDMSEKRRLDQQLVQSGKLAAIGELAAGVAHEINNPLFAILGLTEFLLKEAEPGSKAEQRLVLIQQTGLEIKEIVRALLDFARENAEERHVVALDDVIRSTVDLIRRTNAHKAIELVDTYADDGALVSASPNQLKQIFLNLIANARQAMPNGGSVGIEVHRDGGHVIAVVSDDGPGIAPTALERIFEPFFTTKRLTGGTGPRPVGQPRDRRVARRHADRSLRVRARRGVHASAPDRRGGSRDEPHPRDRRRGGDPQPDRGDTRDCRSRRDRCRKRRARAGAARRPPTSTSS